MCGRRGEEEVGIGQKTSSCVAGATNDNDARSANTKLRVCVVANNELSPLGDNVKHAAVTRKYPVLVERGSGECVAS